VGGGGVLNVARNDVGTIGFSVNGNWSGNEGTRVAITGQSSSAAFDMTASGNASVQLPADAINNAEVGDEPGVASATKNPSVALTGGFNTILSRSITCPADGYCVVIASTQAQASHTYGSTSQADFGVSDVAGSLPVNQDVALLYYASLPTGTYTAPVTVHGTFGVSAGLSTFYLIGREISGAFSAVDTQLTVMYFPTAYGTVTPTLLARGTTDDAHTPQALPMSAAELAAERAESVAFDRARRDREFAEMQALVREMHAQLQEVQQELGQAKQRAEPIEVESDLQLPPMVGENSATSR